MIPEECTHLAPADFPIAVLSKHSVLEKSMRHGLPSSLHPWSVRQPLAGVILKVARIDILPHSPQLAGQLGRHGGQIKNEAEKELPVFCHEDSAAASPIAHIRPRTVRRESSYRVFRPDSRVLQGY
jgi:hypothetical protein